MVHISQTASKLLLDTWIGFKILHIRIRTPPSMSQNVQTDGLQLMMVQLNKFLTLWRCESHTYSVETVLWIFQFNLFPGYRHVVWYSLMMLGSSSELQLPVRHTVTRANDWHSTVCCVPSIFFVLFFWYWVLSTLKVG